MDELISEGKINKYYPGNVVTYSYVIAQQGAPSLEFNEKAAVFRYENSVYLYSSSVNESLAPERAKYKRGKTYFSGMKVGRIGGETIYVKIVKQSNQKISTSPAELKKYFGNYYSNLKLALIQSGEKMMDRINKP